ncbi:MAG: ABC transporter ATP-binding protein [Desulfobacteraceae bacterium]|nr:MAG: ABC transporter ATP-binding protein [Desulfobacteraceae bacterium]
MALSLECRDLCFTYSGKHILKGISFRADPGKFYAILGRNGSGKTTLLHCLNGILRPGAGQVIIRSTPISELSQKEIARQISLVPQEHIDIFPFKVIDVVVMGRAPFIGVTQSPSNKDYDLAWAALNTLNACNLARKNFNRISGGERQIVLLASALAQSTPFMLLDEPTNHLDFNNQYHLLSRIKHLCQTRKLCVMATMHDPNMAMLFADHVIMIKDGMVLENGPAREVMTADHIGRLYDTQAAAVPITSDHSLFLPRMLLTACAGEEKPICPQ